MCAEKTPRGKTFRNEMFLSKQNEIAKTVGVLTSSAGAWVLVPLQCAAAAAAAAANPGCRACDVPAVRKRVGDFACFGARCLSVKRTGLRINPESSNHILKSLHAHPNDLIGGSSMSMPTDHEISRVASSRPTRKQAKNDPRLPFDRFKKWNDLVFVVRN